MHDPYQSVTTERPRSCTFKAKPQEVDKMRKCTALIAVIVLMSFGLGGAQQEGQKLFQKALAMERGEGNLEEAINLYQQVTQEAKDESLAAKAQLRIGICYEKLGKAEAQKAYQVVIEKYPGQTAQVVEARSRMAELSAKKPVRAPVKHLYSWRKDNFYLESRSLSPDGSKLLGIDISTGQNVAYKDLMTGKFKNITKFDWDSEGHGWTYNPVWSPDGTEVAFNYHGWKNPGMELRIADLKGRSRTILRYETRKDVIYPIGWFPDGRSILAMHITSKNQLQLGTVPADGGEFKLLYEPDVPTDGNFHPNARRHIQADLSPDGKYIVFHKAEGKVKNLYVMDLATKNVRSLTVTPANDMSPQWSPDGKHIAFLSDRLGSKALWAIPMDKDGKPEGQPFLMRDGMEHTEWLANWTVHGITYSKFVEMRDIYTMGIDPQSGAPTDKPHQLDFRPTGNNWHPVYSPDGTKLVFLMDPEEEPRARNLIVYSASSGEAQSFRVPTTNLRASLRDICWLPDSSGVSFSGQPSSETPGWQEGMKPFRFFQLELDTGEWRTWDLGGKAWHRSAWRGDGLGLFYNRMRIFPGNWNIIEKDIQTGEERVFFEKGSPFLRCSRDYTKLLSGAKGFVIIDAKSGEKLKEFKDFGVPYLVPAWSPDGKYLMTRSADKETSYTVISYADGTSREYDLSGSLTDGEIRHMDWSPLGDQMAFSFRFRQLDSYLITNVIPEDKK